MTSKKSITLKLMHGCNPFEIKNRDNLVEVKLLLFAANFAINNLSDQLS